MPFVTNFPCLLIEELSQKAVSFSVRCIYTCQVLRLGREVAGACDDIIDMRVNMSHLHQADLHTGATVTSAND